jgi:S1-C subfamily serine protease
MNSTVRLRFRFMGTIVVAALGVATTIANYTSAQEPTAATGLQAAAALEDVMIHAIERSEASVVSIARVDSEPGEVDNFRPELLPRPGLTPFGEPPAPGPASPDFVPNDFATGVIIDKSGLIVTTYHAVMPPGDLWVTTSARRPLRAQIRGADPRSDLAVLRIVDAAPGVEFKPMTFGDPTKLKKGQIVITLGNPYAIARDGQASAGWGIIANLSRKAGPNESSTADDAKSRKSTLHHFGTLIQTDAKLNLGTSGGALLNLKGEMVGLTTSQAAVAGFEQSAGYAIPCDELFHRVVDMLKQGKEVDYGLLGIQLRPLSPTEIASGMHGVHVERVLPGSPAERAGIYPGDVITHVGNRPINDVDDLMLQVGRQPAAADTNVTVDRSGREERKLVTLAKYEVVGRKIITAPDSGWRGLSVDFPSAHSALNPQMNFQFEFRRPNTDPAVLTVDVATDSPAWHAGLRRGMLITHVGNVPVTTPKEFYAQVAAQKGSVDLRVSGAPDQPPVVKVPAP